MALIKAKSGESFGPKLIRDRAFRNGNLKRKYSSELSRVQSLDCWSVGVISSKMFALQGS